MRRLAVCRSSARRRIPRVRRAGAQRPGGSSTGRAGLLVPAMLAGSSATPAPHTRIPPPPVAGIQQPAWPHAGGGSASASTLSSSSSSSSIGMTCAMMSCCRALVPEAAPALPRCVGAARSRVCVAVRRMVGLYGRVSVAPPPLHAAERPPTCARSLHWPRASASQRARAPQLRRRRDTRPPGRN